MRPATPSSTAGGSTEKAPASGLGCLLLACSLLLIARALMAVADAEFWWPYPRPRAAIFVLAYGLGLVAVLSGSAAAAWLVFRGHGLRRAAGLAGAWAMLSLLYELTLPDMRSFMGETWDAAAGHIQPASVEYRNERAAIVLSGELTLGTAGRFRTVLEEHAHAKQVELESNGGLIYEAKWISKLIQERGLDTVIRRECHSACVDIFAAGQRRLMHASAIVGLHSARSFTGEVETSANKAFAERLYKIGVEPRFLMVGTDTPPDDIWINTARQAYIAGLATAVVE